MLNHLMYRGVHQSAFNVMKFFKSLWSTQIISHLCICTLLKWLYFSLETLLPLQGNHESLTDMEQFITSHKLLYSKNK